MSRGVLLFSAPMVRAILAGTKTQTRRAVKLPRSRSSFVLLDHGNGWWPYQSDDGESELCNDGNEHPYTCPYGQTGELIAVRETFYAFGRWETRYSEKKVRDEWHFVDMTLECGKQYRYAADMVGDNGPRQRGDASPQWWKRPAIFMPLVASRIMLEITAVRVEHLNDISKEDAIAEGLDRFELYGTMYWRDYSLSDEDAECSPMRECPIESYRTLWEHINGRGSWAQNPWVWVVEFKRVEGGAHEGQQ